MESKVKQGNAVIRVCIDGKEDMNIYGKLHTPYKEEAIEFFDIVGLLTKIDNIADERNFPNKMFNRRYLDKKLEKVISASKSNDLEANCVRSIHKINQEYGKLLTMNLYVNSRKNTSIQGHVVFIGEGKLEKFESELELIEVIEVYMNGTEDVNSNDIASNAI